MLNNRELASVILVGGFVLVMCIKTDVRSSVGQLLRSIVASKLMIIWVIYAGAVAGAVYGESKIGVHYDAYIKDAVVWAVIAGLPLLGKFDAVSKDPELLGRLLLDAVRVTAFVEVFVNLYVFPLWVEIPGQAFVALVAMTSVVAGMDEANKPVKHLLDGVLGVAGVTAIAWTDGTWRRTGPISIGGNGPRVRPTGVPHGRRSRCDRRRRPRVRLRSRVHAARLSAR